MGTLRDGGGNLFHGDCVPDDLLPELEPCEPTEVPVGARCTLCSEEIQTLDLYGIAESDEEPEELDA